MLIYSFITDYQVFNLRYKDNTTRDKNETKVGKQSANLGKNNEPIQNRLSFLIDCKSVILHHLTILSFPMVRPAWDNWWLLVVAVINSPKHDFSRCKSVIYKFLFRDTKSARDKNGTKPRKNKVKNTSLEISLVEYLCFVCKGTNLSLEKRGEIPISLIHNSFSYHCTPNVVIASDFDLKQHDLRKSGVKFCFALCWTFSKTRTGNRTKDLPPLLSNPWFCECLNDRHLKMLNFK